MSASPKQAQVRPALHAVREAFAGRGQRAEAFLVDWNLKGEERAAGFVGFCGYLFEFDARRIILDVHPLIHDGRPPSIDGSLFDFAVRLRSMDALPTAYGAHRTSMESRPALLVRRLPSKRVFLTHTPPEP